MHVIVSQNSRGRAHQNLVGEGKGKALWLSEMSVSFKRLRKTVLHHQYPQLFLELRETYS